MTSWIYWFQQGRPSRKGANDHSIPKLREHSWYASLFTTQHQSSTSNSHQRKPKQQERQCFRPVVPSSDLWDLVLFSDWDRAVDHVRTNPHDAEWTDGHYHESVLYLACQQHNPPVSIVRGILHAYPEAATVRNSREHDLPLHIACQYQLGCDILTELLKDHPETAVEQTRWGRTPLTNLWTSRQKQDQSGTSTVPMQDDYEFWNKVMVLLNAVARFREGGTTTTTATTVHDCRIPSVTTRTVESQIMDPVSLCLTGDGDMDDHIESSHEKSSLIMDDDNTVCTTHHGPDNSFVVHAAVSLGALCCPLGVLEYVLDHFPEQVYRRDGHGQLPLHVALGRSYYVEATRRRYRPRERDFIAALLRMYPDAARETLLDDDENDGVATTATTTVERTRRHHYKHPRRRHPLHVALVNRHMWSGGVKELFYAAPDVVMIQDPITMLYPFQLAAVLHRGESNDTSSSSVDLETIYHLLRSRPEILHLFVVDDNNVETIKEHPAGYCDGQQQEIWRIYRRKTSEGTSHCPPFLQEALLGTATAILIGSVAGTIYAE